MDLTHSRVTLKKKPRQKSSTDAESSSESTPTPSRPMDLRQSISKAAKATENHKHYFHRFHTDIEKQDSAGTEATIAKEVEAQLKETLPEGTQIVHHYYKCFEDNSEKEDKTHVTNVTELRQMLRWAIRLELSAIPPYLFALYSLKNKKSETYALIKSIAVEEMLHVALVANLLTAIGGVPTFYDPKSMPLYPHSCPHQANLTLSLLPLNQENIKQFLDLERPDTQARARVQEGVIDDVSDGIYKSIGSFYASIEGALEKLSKEIPTLFDNPRLDHQMTTRNYKEVHHNSLQSGDLIFVKDLPSARAAISTILNQGEGISDTKYADESLSEMTHINKLTVISEDAENIGECYPCRANPKTADYPANIQVLSNLFNTSYAVLMLTLQELYMEADHQGRLNKQMYVVMEKIMRPSGQLLCSLALEDGSHAGPTFEPVIFEKGETPIESLKKLAHQALALFPDDKLLNEKMNAKVIDAM